MMGLLNHRITEYASDVSISNAGMKSNAYTKTRSYAGRLDAITRERAGQIFGLHENVEYRLFSICPPTLGGFVKVDDRYLRILRSLPIQGKAGIHHHEAAVG